MAENVLYYGDNLDILRKHVPNESVDLVYLDPPFNSNRSYNVLFKSRSGADSQAQVEAFDDTWTWSQQAEEMYLDLIQGTAPPKVADALEAMRRLLGDNDVLAYLVMMTGRLLELHRVLKPTGSLYLHCDPTASHYLKVLLDAIFGAERFVNEVIWKRTSAHSDVGQGAAHMGRIHDVILFYSKTKQRAWTTVYTPYTDEYIENTYRGIDPDGRRFQTQPLHAKQPGGDTLYEWKGAVPPAGRYWAYSKENMEKMDAEGRIYYSRTGTPRYKIYLDEALGRPTQDLWDDIAPVHTSPSERLGYPTQKPVALLERIINMSSNPGDIVLDPFCGCGTTVDAAQKLGRRWIGIDVTYIAVDLIDKRLRSTYGEEVRADYTLRGIPHDLDGALALFNQNPFDFERWAVSMVDGQPNEKQVGDKGIDGVIRFPVDNKKGVGRALVSVKGGRQLNPGMVRDLVGTVEQQKADMGVFLCLGEPTRGMIEVANGSGSYAWPVDGRTFPKVQILSVADLLAKKKPAMPTPFLPYVQARRLVDENALRLF